MGLLTPSIRDSLSRSPLHQPMNNRTYVLPMNFSHTNANMQYLDTSGFIGCCGLSTIDAHGRAYLNGQALNFAKKVSVGYLFEGNRSYRGGGMRPNFLFFFPENIKWRGVPYWVPRMRLCFSVMNVVNPVQITKDKDPQETGAIALTNLDAFILGVICHREPNITYSPWLSVCALQFKTTGATRCPKTIFNFFAKGFKQEWPLQIQPDALR